jgi:glucoamylase
MRLKRKLSLIRTGMAASNIRWTSDDWKTYQDVETEDTGLGIHMANLPTESVPEGKQIEFTFRWQVANRWEGVNLQVQVASKSK